MIRFEHVSVTYADSTIPVLRDVDLTIPDGELVLVIGRTGAGKSTLLKAVNGLVPHFTGGTLTGRVLVDERDTRTHPPRELADLVGYVGQDPLAGFVADVVEDEIAYTLESLAVEPAVMRRRVEDALDALGLAELRNRPLVTLSAGQQQRVAIGSALAAGVHTLVLDEPTSALDPRAAEDVLANLTRLVHDLGITVLLAEHRLERVIQYADRVFHVNPDGTVTDTRPQAAMATSVVAPPVVELGRIAGWDPLPLSVRDARAAAAGLRDRLGALTPPPRAATATPTPHADAASAPNERGPLIRVDGLVARYDDVEALRGVDLTIAAGEVVAVMGRNGAGKTTLLAHLVGMYAPARGSVEVLGRAPHRRAAAQLVGEIGLVPQEPADLFFRETVAEECAHGGHERRGLAILERLAPGVERGAHPRDLSEGQRLALALAIVLATQPAALLLDEPTRGLDYPGKARLVDLLAEYARAGTAIVLATHDVELAAEVATRTVVMAEGEIVADGPTREVVTVSPAFAPQVAKILAPLPWLTVNQVRAGLEASAR